MKIKYLLLIVLISLLLYLPSFSMFFTNDDFFLLKISQADTIGDFVNFFNFSHGPDGLGMYRPLAIQVFYFIANAVFKLNPLPMHVIVFITFSVLLVIVYRISNKIFTFSNFGNVEELSLISTFLYAVSSTHFGHMFYLATYQEVLMTTFALLSVMLFVSYLERYSIIKLLLSILFFILSLLSKENAVIVPLLIMLTIMYKKYLKNNIKIPLTILSLVPFFVILILYLYYHFFIYGIAQGDSYVWNFGFKKMTNTLAWYLLWSFNLPEMLVDYVGPSFTINPNLYKYWGKEIIRISTLFVGFMILLLSNTLFRLKYLANRKGLLFFFYSLLWFVVSLFPVIFLPIHKFSFYLTLPIIGVVWVLSAIMSTNKNKIHVIVMLVLWLCLSYFTLKLSIQTSWITRGQQISKNVYQYINNNKDNFIDKTIIFYDKKTDNDLPWSPSNTLKTALSDNNFFEIYWNNQIEARYEYHESIEKGFVNVYARQFLGY